MTNDSENGPDIAEIDVDQLADLLTAGNVRLIDVREPDEYAEAHVPGAVLIPLQTVPDNLEAFAGDGPTYVICAAGGRSLRAAQFVAQHGIEAINVAGGTRAWLQAGHQAASGGA